MSNWSSPGKVKSVSLKWEGIGRTERKAYVVLLLSKDAACNGVHTVVHAPEKKKNRTIRGLCTRDQTSQRHHSPVFPDSRYPLTGFCLVMPGVMCAFALGCSLGRSGTHGRVRLPSRSVRGVLFYSEMELLAP